MPARCVGTCITLFTPCRRGVAVGTVSTPESAGFLSAGYRETGMQTLTEKRVFGAKTGVTDIFVSTDSGVAAVTVSADQIGAFGLAQSGVGNRSCGDGRPACRRHRSRGARG